MIDTYFLKIDNYIDQPTFNKLLTYVSKEKRERIFRYYHFQDAQKTLLGDILARYAICRRMHIENKDLVFGINLYGKPFLITPPEVHFNISHSGNWVVCALDHNPIGIDVEVVVPIDFKIAERFFTEEEYYTLLVQPPEMQLAYFYKVWTLKESYVKLLGNGLSIPFNSFSLKTNNDKKYLLTENANSYYFHQSFLCNDCIYSICTSNNKLHENTYFEATEFLKQIHI